MSVTMSLAEFEDLVAEALDSIPDDLASHMENIAWGAGLFQQFSDTGCAHRMNGRDAQQVPAWVTARVGH